VVDFLEELFFVVEEDFFLVVEVPFLVVDDDFLAVDEGFFVVVVLFFLAVVDFFLAVVDFLVVVEAFFVVGFLVVFVVDISSMVLRACSVRSLRLQPFSCVLTNQMTTMAPTTHFSAFFSWAVVSRGFVVEEPFVLAVPLPVRLPLLASRS
jgi:hypothetical protein